MKLKSFTIRTIVIVLLFMGIFSSCEKQDQVITEDITTTALFEKNEYNLDLQDFSIAVSNALKNSQEFRKIIKAEALQMVDGDYDVILKSIINKKVSPIGTSLKQGKTNYSIQDLLEDSYPDNKETSLKSSASIIDMLSEKYPLLQIAVPIHAEAWDELNYVPTVTFLPAEYSDATTKKITGYDANGKVVQLDVINKPSMPVIVIGENERLLRPIDDEEPGVPETPTNLSGIQTESGIRLNWQMPSTANSLNTTGYYVYRKSTSDPYYIKIKTIPGVFNRSYDDNSVEASRSYTYYVMAYYQFETSGSSNYVTITAPNYPKPVLSFDAIQNSKTEIELRWENDHSQYILETKVSKHVVGVTSNYQLLSTFSANDQDYFDHDLILGKKVIYKINHVTALGESNAKYDFVQVPYRDISQKSPVYIKQIKFTDWSLERWPAGKPEFYITVTNTAGAGQTPYVVQENIICNFSEKENISQVFTGRKVLDWQPGFWFDMLSFNVIEYDRSWGKLKVSAAVGYNNKNAEKTSLNTNLGVSYEITFSDKGEKCGNSYLDYFEHPEKWLVFPNYGVQVLVSESDQ